MLCKIESCWASKRAFPIAAKRTLRRNAFCAKGELDDNFKVRDERRPGHHWADNEVIDIYGKQIGPVGYAIYMFLGRYSGNANGKVNKSQQDIADAFGISRDTVNRHLNVLIECKLIATEENPGKPLNYIMGEVPKGLSQNQTGVAAKSDRYLPQNQTGVAAKSDRVAAKSDSHNNKEFKTSYKTNKTNAVEQEPPPKVSPKQANLDAWDLRRWQEIMKTTEPQTGNYIANPDEHWNGRAREAAFMAGIPPDRLIYLLKQHFPQSKSIDTIFAPQPLFTGSEKA